MKYRRNLKIKPFRQFNILFLICFVAIGFSSGMVFDMLGGGSELDMLCDNALNREGLSSFGLDLIDQLYYERDPSAYALGKLTLYDGDILNNNSIRDGLIVSAGIDRTTFTSMGDGAIKDREIYAMEPNYKLIHQAISDLDNLTKAGGHGDRDLLQDNRARMRGQRDCIDRIFKAWTAISKGEDSLIDLSDRERDYLELQSIIEAESKEGPYDGSGWDSDDDLPSKEDGIKFEIMDATSLENPKEIKVGASNLIGSDSEVWDNDDLFPKEIKEQGGTVSPTPLKDPLALQSNGSGWGHDHDGFAGDLKDNNLTEVLANTNSLENPKAGQYDVIGSDSEVWENDDEGSPKEILREEGMAMDANVVTNPISIKDPREIKAPGSPAPNFIKLEDDDECSQESCDDFPYNRLEAIVVNTNPLESPRALKPFRSGEDSIESKIFKPDRSLIVKD